MINNDNGPNKKELMRDFLINLTTTLLTQLVISILTAE